MRPMKTTPTPISSAPSEHALPMLTDRARDFITARLARRDPPERIAADLRALFQIEIAGDQLVPCWQAHKRLPTQTERRPDKESMQLPADEVEEPLTRPTSEETPAFAIARDPDRRATDAGATPPQATQTGHRQDPASLQIPADTVDQPHTISRARSDALDALETLAKARLGIAPKPDPDPAAATQTGRRQTQKKPPRKSDPLTDEVKAFIVRGLARYETPSRVAAAVKANFDIEIDRRQVFAYDPAGSRPPAQRWIDLHAATRAKFMQASTEIGIAQKIVRLRMLDRFANRAEENHYHLKAAKYLEQAARECGGFYERQPRMAAPPARGGSR